MNRLQFPWRPGQPLQFKPHEMRSVSAADVVEARRLMSAAHGPALGLNEAAQVLGVLAGDLDRALWREIGRSK